MALAVQHPEQRGEVAVVMRGKEGTGKGIFASSFGKLFGSHFLQITQGKHLTGHFNAHLQNCSVLFADEAFVANDVAHASVLKSIITEEILMIEPKGLDPFSSRNRIHLIMASNDDWVIPAGADARRYFVLDVSDKHKQDTRYFGAIIAQMDAGGREALLHLLKNRDLTAFDVREVPQTGALAEQKMHTRKGVDRLVEMIASEGVIPCATVPSEPRVAVTTGEDEGKGFYAAAKSMVPDLKYRGSIPIVKALTNEWGCERWRAANQRGIRFPSLAELRVRVDQKHGRQDWPDVPAWVDDHD
jgi:hypothetical protein